MSSDDRDQRDQIVLEARRSDSPSAARAPPSPYELRYQFRPPADGPVGLLERPEQPTVERPGAPRKPEGRGARRGRASPQGLSPPAPDRRGLRLAVPGPGRAARDTSIWDYAAHFESTDDAFIAARQFSIAPKVAGYVTAVPVTDNEHVAAGRGDRPHRRSRLPRRARAGRGAGRRRPGRRCATSTRRSDVQQAQISANQAQVDQAQATLVFAQAAGGRATSTLVEARLGDGSARAAIRRRRLRQAQQAAVDNAQATLKLAQRQIETLKAQRDSAEANLAQAKAQRDQAQLNLSYTTVIADQPGRVVNLSAAVGEYASPGTALVHVRAGRHLGDRELQGDPARPRCGRASRRRSRSTPIRNATFHGHVASVQPGSGTAFSLLPAENATGNYVKIVQRVPVKIVMDDPPTDVALGPGMSVDPDACGSIRRPSLYERLKADAESCAEARR